MQKVTRASSLDEIHLILIIRVVNIVGLSDNSNKVATNVFAFMLSSVFSQYKDVLQVAPTKRLKAENLT